jgi:hypothetical protein
MMPQAYRSYREGDTSLEPAARQATSQSNACAPGDNCACQPDAENADVMPWRTVGLVCTIAGGLCAALIYLLGG